MKRVKYKFESEEKKSSKSIKNKPIPKMTKSNSFDEVMNESFDIIPSNKFIDGAAERSIFDENEENESFKFFPLDQQIMRLTWNVMDSKNEMVHCNGKLMKDVEIKTYLNANQYGQSSGEEKKNIEVKLVRNELIDFYRFAPKETFDCNLTYDTGHINNHKSISTAILLPYMEEKFIWEPLDVSKPSGEMIELRCTAPAASPPAKIFWVKNGKLIMLRNTIIDKELEEFLSEHQIDKMEDNSRYLMMNDNSLVIHESNIKEDDGEYICIAHNLAHTRMANAAKVKIFEPKGWSSWTSWSESCLLKKQIDKLAMEYQIDGKISNNFIKSDYPSSLNEFCEESYHFKFRKCQDKSFKSGIVLCDGGLANSTELQPCCTIWSEWEKNFMRNDEDYVPSKIFLNDHLNFHKRKKKEIRYRSCGNSKLESEVFERKLEILVNEFSCPREEVRECDKFNYCEKVLSNSDYENESKYLNMLNNGKLDSFNGNNKINDGQYLGDYNVEYGREKLSDYVFDGNDYGNEGERIIEKDFIYNDDSSFIIDDSSSSSSPSNGLLEEKVKINYNLLENFKNLKNSKIAIISSVSSISIILLILIVLLMLFIRKRWQKKRKQNLAFRNEWKQQQLQQQQQMRQDHNSNQYQHHNLEFGNNMYSHYNSSNNETYTMNKNTNGSNVERKKGGMYGYVNPLDYNQLSRSPGFFSFLTKSKRLMKNKDNEEEEIILNSTSNQRYDGECNGNNKQFIDYPSYEEHKKFESYPFTQHNNLLTNIDNYINNSSDICPQHTYQHHHHHQQQQQQQHHLIHHQHQPQQQQHQPNFNDNIHHHYHCSNDGSMTDGNLQLYDQNNNKLDSNQVMMLTDPQIIQKNNNSIASSDRSTNFSNNNKTESIILSGNKSEDISPSSTSPQQCSSQMKPEYFIRMLSNGNDSIYHQCININDYYSNSNVRHCNENQVKNDSARLTSTRSVATTKDDDGNNKRRKKRSSRKRVKPLRQDNDSMTYETASITMLNSSELQQYQTTKQPVAQSLYLDGIILPHEMNNPHHNNDTEIENKLDTRDSCFFDQTNTIQDYTSSSASNNTHEDKISPNNHPASNRKGMSMNIKRFERTNSISVENDPIYQSIKTQ
ncbi:hypothetical protein SNEBB_007811 [Seison nebaliae]|nr:hypothetical protein SNEBB_007811 [Seison nebaliae]